MQSLTLQRLPLAGRGMLLRLKRFALGQCWVTLPLGNGSCIIHMDVVNADIAGANICPCSRNPIYII
ncbi:MAG: hypothetical protein Q7U18_12025 [Methylobacter sp.]|nr:hypothetical protein [Methylobacter sp.]